jgi:hypothetical protein
MTATATNPEPLRLTARWTPLRSHQEQSRLFHQKKRFKMAPAARRSGKTEIAKRKLILALLEVMENPREWADPRFFAAAPTRDQAKRIWWRDLKALTPRDWIAEIRESDLCIVTTWGAELWVLGLDKPERIEGVSWDGGVVDELANCRPGIFDAHIRPALADRKGWCWMIGVPDMHSPAQVEYERMVRMARSGEDPEWGCYSWPSADILDPEEVESARRRMAPDMFAQEFMGEFIKLGGLAFPDFSEATHVRPTPHDPALPLCWSLDFNINPMCSGIIQHHKDMVRVVHEFTLADSSTDVACEAFLSWCDANSVNPRDVAVYGDATGNARDSTSGVTDWSIVAARLKNFQPNIKVPKSSPAIKDTLNAVRARLRTADGATHIQIDPSCKRLIEDFQTLLWPSDLESGHCMAWLRYFCEWEYPVGAFELPEGRFG